MINFSLFTLYIRKKYWSEWLIKGLLITGKLVDIIVKVEKYKQGFQVC